MDTQPEPAPVVAGFDGSDPSRAAVSLAVRRAAAGGRVYVVHCLPEGSAPLGSELADERSAADHARVQELHERLPEAARALEADGRLEWEILTGDAAAGIRRVADVRGAAEIVIGTRGHGRARSLLGSVAHALLSHADLPVLVVPERAVAAVERQLGAGAGG